MAKIAMAVLRYDVSGEEFRKEDLSAYVEREIEALDR